MEGSDGACGGVFSQHLSPEIIFLLPKDVAPVWLQVTYQLLRYLKSGAASLFNTVNVTPQTAIHYHSNEPATMEEKT